MRFCITILVLCLASKVFPQGITFALPPTASEDDYQPGMVWVKVKSAYKDVLCQDSSGRRSTVLPGSSVRPLLPRVSQQITSGRIAPRKQHIDVSRYYLLKSEQPVSIENYINDLYSTGYFEVVEPIYKERSLLTPNDPAIANQYYLNLVNAQEAWDITTGSTSIVIAIVDTGGDLNHPDLQNNIYIDPTDPTDGLDNNGDGYVDNNRGWDFSGSEVEKIGTPGYKGDNDPSVYSGNRFAHGTMVAGLASASTNNGIGISGIGYHTKLMFTKHYADNQPDNSNFYSSNLYEGILYAANHGAKIINCSWGNPNASSIAQDLIKHVTLDLGCIVVAAVGNSNSETPLYPAAYDHVLAVASSDQNDLRSWFSNYGKHVDIIAPGSDLFTTNYNDAYRNDSGSSLSTPIVSGAAALVWAHNPGLTGMQVAEQLRVSADEAFYDNNQAYVNKLGKGRLDIQRALTFQSPSVRAINPSIQTSEQETPGPGESAALHFDFVNFLSPTSSALTVTLTAVSPFVTITQNEFKIGLLNTGDTASNEDEPFKLILNPNFPIDGPAEFMLTFTDGTYHDTQTFTYSIPTTVDITENNIRTSITSSGALGFGNSQSQSNGLGFIYDDQSLLYEMGVIMGTSSALIYDNVRGIAGTYNRDFTSATKIEKETYGKRSNSEVTGSFRNAPTEAAASLQVTFQSMVWQNDPYRNFVILEYKVKNTTSSPLTNFYMGLFADWDVLLGGSTDQASWDNQTRLGYVFSALPSTRPRVGIQALTGNPNYYPIDNDHTIPGNPLGIYDGFTDAEKFTALSNGLAKTTAGGSSGNDVSHLVSEGPYIINPGQEITVAFALHGAKTQADLIKSAKYADSLYNYTFKAPKPVTQNIESCDGSDAILTATGATKFKWYKTSVGGSSIFSGSKFTISDLAKDTTVYVSNADKTYESLRTPVSVKIRPTPFITASGDLDFCEGGSVILKANGGENYTWNTGEETTEVEVTSSSSHSVTTQYQSIECESGLANVAVYPIPTAQFLVEDTGFATGQEITFHAQSSGATIWSWDFGDGETSSLENPKHSYSAIGEYVVSLTASSHENCADTETKTIGVITATESSLEKNVVLYPNPVHGERLLIHNSGGHTSFVIKVFNAQGGLVLQTDFRSDEQIDFLDLSYLANGIYQVQIQSENEVLVKKVVIARK